MEREKLLEYLKSICQLESTAYSLNQLSKKLYSKKMEVLMFKEKEKEQYYYVPDGGDLLTDYIFQNGFGGFIKSIIIYIFAGLIAGGIVGVVLWLFKVKNASSIAELIALFYAPVAGLFTLISRIASYHSDKKAAIYANSQVMETNLDIEIQNSNGLADAKSKSLALTNELDVLHQKQTEIQSTLDAYYSLDILYPKYRNFAAVSSIYEYLLSGRCTSLTGHGGAYDTFENELRLNHIIFGIDRISNNLEQIKKNQYQMYQSLSEGLDRMNRIYYEIDSGLNNLNSTTQSTNHYVQVTAENVQYMRNLQLYNTLRNP